MGFRVSTRFVSLLVASSITVMPVIAAAKKSDSGSSQPSGTLLLPLTPKIDASVASPKTSGLSLPSAGKLATPNAGKLATPKVVETESSYTPPETADAPAASATPSDSTALKPAPRTMSAEIEEDEVVGSAASEVEDDTTLKGTIQIVADDTEYDQDKNTFLGTGNAVAIIGGQNSKLEADTILYDQNTQMIDARGNVRILRGGQLTTGAAFKFKVDADEYLITKPDTELNGVQVVARRGYGAKGGLQFKDGAMTLPNPLYFTANGMWAPTSYTEEMQRKIQHPDAYMPEKPSFVFKARKIVSERYKEAGNVTVFGGRIVAGNFTVPLPKFTATVSKNENNVTFPVTPTFGNNLQVGGFHIGPSFNTAIGKTGKLSWMPMLQLGGRTLQGQTGKDIGLGGQVAFQNRRYQGHLAYGSNNNVLVADLKGAITKTSGFQLGVNRFLSDGMMGYRRARLLAEVADNRTITGIPFLNGVNFRTSAGWAQDNPQLLNMTPEYAKLFGNDAKKTVQATAFKFQEQITATTHPLFAVGNDKVGVKSYLYGGAALRGYSSGDASIIGQIGPALDVRLNRLRLMANYTQSGVKGSSPFVFDQFIQGNRSVSFSGDIKVNKYLTLGGSIGYNLNAKLYYGKALTAAIGPEDFKLLIRRDLVTGMNRMGFDVLYGSAVPFQKMVLKGGPDQGQLGGI